MEACGANFLDEDWESLSKMFSIEECISYSDETDESSLNFFNQQNLSYDHGLTTFNHQDNNTTETSMNFHMDDNLNTSIFSDDHRHLMENVLGLKPEIWCSKEQLCLRENDDSINELHLKRNYVETSPQSQDDIDSSEGPKKKARARRNYKSKRATQPRKKKKVMADKDSNEEDTINITKGKQISSCCSINIFDQEDSIPNDNSQDEMSKSSVSLNSNGKAKGTKGSGATDSQSLYARRRRERINERLKILQSLVPSGTKVDISTMLEEAVQYVKFLQLQIKLLSSDELWMYAPIAYNGLMDIGMYQKICPNQLP